VGSLITGESPRERIARRQLDKFTERRDHLAAAALATLAERGYANTSLRDIAQHSEFSHGVLHYYFADKFELIAYCVRQYKASRVQRFESMATTAATPSGLALEFGAAMAGSLREQATMHRLWYDLRNQALFEPTFRPEVREIDSFLKAATWAVATRFAELSQAPLTVTADQAYALVDGLFQQGLRDYLAGDDDAAARLEQSMRWVLAAFLSLPAPVVSRARVSRARVSRADAGAPRRGWPRRRRRSGVPSRRPGGSCRAPLAAGPAGPPGPGRPGSRTAGTPTSRG